MKIRDIMKRDVDAVTSDQTIQEAAQKMGILDVESIPVVCNSMVVGLVTERDITVRVVAKGLDPRITKIADAMSQGECSCREDDELGVAAELMNALRIRRLVVRNHGGKLCGVVTLEDLASNVYHTLTHDILKMVSVQ